MNTEIIEQYLDGRGCTMWGRSFNIVSPDSRQQAIEFIKNMCADIEALQLSEWSLQDRLPYA